MTINAASVSWGGLFKSVLKRLQEYSPDAAATERECQHRLTEYLRSVAPEARVEEEYLHNGCRIDLYIGHQALLGEQEVFIEVKLNLSSENEFKRLLGQLALMAPKENCIIVVLFGQTKPEFIARLKSIHPPGEDAFFSRPAFAIVEMPFRS